MARIGIAEIITVRWRTRARPVPLVVEPRRVLPADEGGGHRAGDGEHTERGARGVGELRRLARLQAVDPADADDPGDRPAGDRRAVDRR